jgi:hypothetical protein
MDSSRTLGFRKRRNHLPPPVMLPTGAEILARRAAAAAESVVLTRESPVTELALQLAAGASVSVSSSTNEAAQIDKLLSGVVTTKQTVHIPSSRTTMATAPGDHFKGLVATLRADIQESIAGAKALKLHGAASMAAFKTAKNALASVYLEVDAATAEINGALAAPGDNGAPAGTDVKN